MKEKDIVDFTKMKKNEEDEYIDSEGNEVGCRICYTHAKACEYFENLDHFQNADIHALCPNCGNSIHSINFEVVSEVNYSNPDGEIGYYPVAYCEKCNKYFAFIPQEIEYNANHDIYYTGGRDYITDNTELKKLENEIFESIKPSIKQYIERKMNPEDYYDKELLDMANVMTWCHRDVEHAIANWMYEHGYKK